MPLERSDDDERVRRLLPPAPANPFDLGRHLLEQHRWDPEDTERDADDLRRRHASEHAWSRQLDHVHEGDPR